MGARWQVRVSTALQRRVRRGQTPRLSRWGRRPQRLKQFLFLPCPRAWRPALPVRADAPIPGTAL